MVVINDDVKEDSVTPAVSESVNFFLGESVLSLKDLPLADSSLNNDVKEDSVTAVVSESVNFSFGEVAPSLKDLTWADSCLNTDANDDVDALEPDLSSIKVALSEIFNSQLVEDDSVGAKNNIGDNSFRDYIASPTIGSGSDREKDLKDDIGDTGSLRISDNKVDDPTLENRRASVREKRRIENVLLQNITKDIVKAESNETGADLVNAQLSTGDDLSFGDYMARLITGSGSVEEEDLKENDIDDFGSLQISDNEVDDHVIANSTAKAKGKRRIKKNVIRQNYTKNIVKAESSENGTDLSLTTQEVESSPEDIFKVWDLGISDEQDDFTKQLNKALTEGLLPVNPDDSTAQVEVLNVSVDDLISGIGDLSLKQNTE